MVFGRRPRRAARSVLAVAVAGLVLLAACGGPRYHYVKSSSNRTYMRVPSKWTLYDEDELLDNSEQSDEAKQQFKRLSWSVAFDASPRPSLDHLLSGSDHPTGLVQVRTLLPSERDSFSLADLRSLLLPVDPLSDEAQLSGDVEVLETNDVTRDGMHGSEMLLNLKTPEGDLVKWRQIAVVDPAVRKVHVLAVSCDAECYAANEDVITKVIDSWKVKER
ncbi:MAG: hypothetical protein ACT4PX_09045 [Actinomycetota bacterium]